MPLNRVCLNAELCSSCCSNHPCAAPLFRARGTVVRELRGCQPPHRAVILLPASRQSPSFFSRTCESAFFFNSQKSPETVALKMMPSPGSRLCEEEALRIAPLPAGRWVPHLQRHRHIYGAPRGVSVGILSPNICV